MTKEKRLQRIKELFLKLKSAYDWIDRHADKTDEIEGLWKRSDPVFKELETLGVSQRFSEALLIFGPEFKSYLVAQFAEE